MRKEVIVMGKGSLAIRVAEWFHHAPGYQLSQIVPVVPEPAWTDSLLEWAKKNAIPFVESGDYSHIKDARQEGRQVDLVFSVFYDRIIGEWFISKCKRILNLHNSPLPRYRGVSPINWALKNGELMHGVTIHEMTAGVDEGPIVAQLCYSVYPEFDEVIDVYRRSLAYGWVLFEQTIPLVDKIKPLPQDVSRANYYGVKRNVELGERRHFTKQESINQMILDERQLLEEYAERLRKFQEK